MRTELELLSNWKRDGDTETKRRELGECGTGGHDMDGSRPLVGDYITVAARDSARISGKVATNTDKRHTSLCCGLRAGEAGDISVGGSSPDRWFE